MDDDPGLRDNLAELFRGEGYEVLLAGNAPEALAILRREPVDLLLTDDRMPGSTGLELIQGARRICPGLPVILMTAFGDHFTEIESVRRGAVGYIAKPFDADEIVGLLGRILALREG